MDLVIRSNYGDESIALIEWVAQHIKAVDYDIIYVAYVETGWSASQWEERVSMGEAYAEKKGFKPIRLRSKETFSELVKSRGSFPSVKFQWCAHFLKGLVFMEWLDEIDLRCEALIVLPKRQALYRKPLKEYIKECEFHGERKVWHPMLLVTDEERDAFISQAGFSVLHHASLECAPCIHHQTKERESLSLVDKERLKKLEQVIGKSFFFRREYGKMDGFTMGCGDPFGCGL